jgi:hypothetical protein
MLIMISLSCGVGFLFTQQLQKGNDWTEKIWLKIEHWRKPKPSMRVAYKNEDFSSPKEEKPIEVSQEIVDKILDKISDTGYNSLSHTEREILEKFAGKKKSDN